MGHGTGPRVIPAKVPGGQVSQETSVEDVESIRVCPARPQHELHAEPFIHRNPKLPPSLCSEQRCSCPCDVWQEYKPGSQTVVIPLPAQG